jgi:Zn-dependent M16 (insulinase) family peptidase
VSVQISALETKWADALRIAKEVLSGTRFDDIKAAGDLLKQVRQDMEQGVAVSGNQYAMRRAGARLSRANEMDELTSGIAQLRWLQKANADAELLERYAAFADRIFTSSRLTVCLTDNMPAVRASEVVAAWPKGEPVTPIGSKWKSLISESVGSEGFTIPAEVAYAGVASRLPVEVPYHGSQIVSARILTLDYLWNEIRVLGGAYGMGLVVRADGDVQYMTYRDPNPARSFEKIAEAGAALKKFCEAGNDIDKYVVSAIGKTEPYLSPRLETQRASDIHLSGRTVQDLENVRAEILSTSKAGIMKFADTLDALSGKSSKCVVGGKKPLAQCELSTVESVADVSSKSE